MMIAYHLYQPASLMKCTKYGIREAIDAVEILMKRGEMENNRVKIIIQAEDASTQEELHEHVYDKEMLKEQILLFENDTQIQAYIQVEKLQASPLLQLTSLCFSLIKIIQQQWEVEVAKSREKQEEDPRENESSCYFQLQLKQSYPPIALKLPSVSTYKSVSQFEQQCWQGMEWVRQQRKKMERCCICMERRSQVMLLPCSHLAMCVSCASKVSKCPLCKAHIKERKMLFQ